MSIDVLFALFRLVDRFLRAYEAAAEVACRVVQEEMARWMPV